MSVWERVGEKQRERERVWESGRKSKSLSMYVGERETEREPIF